MTMSESKKKRGKGEKGKQIPPLNQDVKGVIKSFIDYEDDDCVHLSILIMLNSNADRSRLENNIFIRMGNKYPVSVNKRDPSNRTLFNGRRGLLAEDGLVCVGGTDKDEDLPIFNENPTVAEKVFDKIVNLLGRGLNKFSFTRVEPDWRKFRYQGFRQLRNKSKYRPYTAIAGFTRSVSVEDFMLESFQSVVNLRPVTDEIKSIMRRYSEMNQSRLVNRGNNVTKLYEYSDSTNTEIQLFYKICKSQPRGVGLLKLALRKRKKGKGKKRPRTEEGAGAGGPSTSTPQLLKY